MAIAVLRLFLFLCIFHWCSAKYFISAPNLLRVGVKETVSITLFNVGGQVNVKLYLQDFPHKKKTFSQVEGNFVQDRPGLLEVKVDAKDLPDQKSLDKQYVYLVATSTTPGFNFKDEMKILLSYRNAMVFIQVDKPIYTPGQTVHLRVVPLDLDLQASVKNVTIEIMNPQGIRVDRWKNLNTDEGFFSQRKDLSENALLGNWTVNALYGHGLVQNASIQFEVREYVLPRFSVKVKVKQPYILETDQEIEIEVISEYTYGKTVQGSAQVTLAVLDSNGKTQRFSTSFLQLKDGKAIDYVNTDLIKNHPDQLWFPEGKRLFIEAKVIEKATGLEEDVLDNTVYFTKSIYKISFKRTPKFFKPGVPYEIKMDVSYLNGKPAPGVDIEIDAKTDAEAVVHERQQAGRQANTDTTNQLGQGRFVIDVPKTYTIKHLVIKVKTKTQIVSEEEFRPTMYTSSNNNYLFVRAPKSNVGDSIDAEAFVLSTGNPRSLSYFVIAHGKIVVQDTIVKNLGIVTTIRFVVTPEMSPRARFVVYYTVGEEVVADSAVMEVAERFPNQVAFNRKYDKTKAPGESERIQIKADPHSWIGILAVDQSVYLLRDDKQLTSDRVFNRVKSHDLGCGSGAGQNNKDVFTRGGLAVMSDYGNFKTSLRDDYRCSAAYRKRRSIDQNQDRQKQCCSLGVLPDSRDCSIRAQEFSKNVSQSLHPVDKCVIAFYLCCRKKAKKYSRGRAGNDDLPPDLLNNLGFEVDEDMLKETLEDAQLRTHFPETWLYEDKKAGKDGLVEFKVTLPDTITTWVMQAIAVSNTTGFGLTPPTYLTAFKAFFVSLSMPYSARRREQVSIVATIYNYNGNPFGDAATQIRLYLFGSRDFCSLVEPDERAHVYKLELKGKDPVSVSFPIVPITLGDIPIRVTAASMFSGDSIEKILKVLPEGIQRRKSYSVVLDPQGVLQDPKAPKLVQPTTPSAIKAGSKGNGEQKNSLLLKIPDLSIPGSESAQLFIMGNLLGPVVANVIEGRGLNSLIRMPSGCGEQTMINLAPNVFVFQYLRSTKQVTPQIETNAFNLIRSGYQRELNYRRSDHSFSAFGNTRPGSTWLTAFVIKTFCAAQKLDGVEVDQEVICSAIRWFSQIQRADGVIPENQPVIHQEMNGDINGDLAMTAYVVTALLECQCSKVNTAAMLSKAVSYLENSRDVKNRVYVKAVIAYALALASSPKRSDANNDLLLEAHFDAGKNARYWTDGGNAIDVETTSYALLTQMALKRLSYSGPIVVWLTGQRKGGGGFVSTQDTCVALQALAAYSQETGGAHLDLTVKITSSMIGDYIQTIRVNKGNALVQQQIDISNLIDGDIFITTTGSGVAQLQVETRYNTPASGVEQCQFDLTVEIVEAVKPALHRDQVFIRKARKNKKGKRGKKDRRKKGKGKKRKGRKGRKNRKNRRRKNNRPKTTPKPTLKPTPKPKLQGEGPVSNYISCKVCASHKKVGGGTTGMAIIDVGVLTGFSVIEKSLKNLRDNLKTISMYEISDRHVILYIDKIVNAQSCFTLEMKRDFEVGLVQSVPVTVYDYYEPDNKCTSFYGPNDDSSLNLAICEKEECKCTTDKCPQCKGPNTDVDSAVDDACKKYDYAFKGKVRAIDEKGYWFYIKIDVEESYKAGKHPLFGKRLTFKKRASCDCPKITPGMVDSEFLIMGKDHGRRADSVNMDNHVFVYKLERNGSGANFLKRFRKGRKEIGKPDACVKSKG